MNKEKAMRIAEQLSEAHVASTCTLPLANGEWKIEIWSTALTHWDFKMLMRVCEQEGLELSYEDQPGEEGSFFLRDAVEIESGFVVEGARSPTTTLPPPPNYFGYDLAPWKDPSRFPRGRIGRGA
jgi:hypothetical protein